MGNPHAVLFVDDVDAAPVATLGPRIESHAAFPNRVNVEFVEIVSRDAPAPAHLGARHRRDARLRERRLRGRGGGDPAGPRRARVTIELRGGELAIEWAAPDAPVFMTGPAAEVFRGTLNLDDPGGA